jgi:Sec-independent protein translocase protein TatA
MRRSGGVIPPGRAGLIVLAVAMVPIAIKKFPKAVRWFGKQLENAGARVQSTVDEVDRYERERQERQQSQETADPRSTVTSTSAKWTHAPTNGVKETKMNDKVAQQDEHEPTPARETASPQAHVEMEAQRTKPKKATTKPAAKGSVRGKPKVQGAAPPANDPKRSRKKSEGQV